MKKKLSKPKKSPAFQFRNCVNCIPFKPTASWNSPYCKDCETTIDKIHAETVTKVSLVITYGDGHKQEVVLR
jgi:hypothetical protein